MLGLHAKGHEAGTGHGTAAGVIEDGALRFGSVMSKLWCVASRRVQYVLLSILLVMMWEMFGDLQK